MDPPIPPTLTGIDDLAIKILALLDVRDLINVSLVSHHFLNLAKDKRFVCCDCLVKVTSKMIKFVATTFCSLVFERRIFESAGSRLA